MKKTTLSLLVIIFLAILQSCDSSKEAASYVITGNISGNADGKSVYLTTALNPQVKLDSTILKDGHFQFKGKADYPQLYDIVIAKNDTPKQKGYGLFQPVIPIFVENSEIYVNGTLDSIPTQDYKYSGGYNYDNVTIKGSAAQETYREFLKGYQPLADARSRLFMDEYIAYLNPGKGQKKGPVSEGVGIVTRLDQAAEKRDAYIKEFISKHNNDMVGLYVASDKLSSFSVEEIDDILESFSSKIKESKAWEVLRKRADEVKKTATGAPYADFSFQDDKGNTVQLSDYLGKGKYVLLEFWASWCGPCRADIPHLKEVYELYHPAGFNVISVSMDDDKEKWLKAIGEEKMTWLQVSDLKAFEGPLSKLYNFNGIPTCLLIAPDGRIVTRNMRGSWMDKKLIELYGNKFGSKF